MSSTRHEFNLNEPYGENNKTLNNTANMFSINGSEYKTAKLNLNYSAYLIFDYFKNLNQIIILESF
jgi:hypothetical protein